MNCRYIRLSLILSFAALLTACRDDVFDIPTSGDAIAFNVSTSSDWSDAEASSRASGEESAPRHKIYVIEGGCSEMSKPFYLHTSEDDWSATNTVPAASSRSTQTSEEAGLKSIFMTSYVSQNGGDHQLYSEQEVLSASDNWKSSHFWPAVSSKLDFYAYGFIGDETKPANLVFTANAPEPPTLTFSTLNGSAETGADLLVGKSEGINASSKPVVAMTMRHALTKIEFEASADFAAGTITAIGFREVHASGNYDYDSEEWNSADALPSTNFRREFPDGIKTDGKTKLPLITGDDAFIMLPQTLGSDSELYIEFTEATTGLEIELVFPLNGFQWAKGKHLRYSLSTNPNMIEDVFRIVLLPEGTVYYPGDEEVEGKRFRDLFKCNYAGTSKQIRVESFEMAVSGSDKHPVYKPHPVEFSVDGTECTITPDETVDGHSPQDGFYGYTIEIDHLNGIVDNSIEPHNAWLKQQSAVGIKNAYNLSNPNNPMSRTIKVDPKSDKPDIGYNTANCYIINAPGKYCLPLVYGNTITAGKPRGSAYYCNTTSYPSKSEWRVLERFPNHKGVDIKTPYIDDSFTPESIIGADILWMDKSNLLKNLNVLKTSEGHFIEFEIPVESIEQGNAVIAVTENGVIAWSWHIWVTDYNCSIEPDITVNTNAHSYQFMARNIGWVYNEPMIYNPTDYNVTASRRNLDKSSDRGNIKASFIIHQSGGSIDCDGYNVFYQWGRMTPFPGGKWSPTQNKDVDCLASGFSVKYIDLPLIGNVVSGSAKDCVIYSIKNPCTFFKEKTLSCWMQTADDHNGDIIVNLWSTYMNYHGEDLLQHYEKQYKSIFDPCPVGYMLPQPDSMDAFDYSHMIIDYDKNGMYYCSFGNNGDVNERELFFPFSGYRLGHDGRYKRGKLDYESIGQYYTNVLFNTQMAYHLCLRSGGVIYNPHPDHSKMIDGMSVRPIRE